MDGLNLMLNQNLKFISIVLCLLTSHLATSQTSSITSSSWENTLKDKKGTVLVYWNTIKPFVYKNSQNQLVGIEVDLLMGLQEHLKTQYDTDLEIKWIEAYNFNTVYDTVKNTHESGTFGISSFSILDERKKQLSFSPSYLKDISIIVSNALVPTAKNESQFLETFRSLKAISLLNSTSEKNLKVLRSQQNIDFEIQHINTTDDMISELDSKQNVFSYVELPIYLAALNNGIGIKRHNFYPVFTQGYGIIYPLHSDWETPIESYFNSISFQYRKDQIISKYLGVDIFNLIKQMGSGKTINEINEIELLTQEKNIQARELNKAALEQQEQKFLRNLLIIGFLFILTVAGVLFYSNRLKAKTNKLLLQQQQKIQQQQMAIAEQNESLESSNKKLNKLNRQKNDLIGVLSHDLRAPINQIKGFAEIYKIENQELPKGQAFLIDKIISTSDRLTTMIRKIMDVEVVDSNKLDINIERVNLSELLKEIALNFKELAKNKEIKITTEIEQNDLHVEADQVYLTQVFENLLSNAIKFSDSNKTVHISLRPSTDKVMAIVKDEGPGLTKDDQKNLFKKYQKLSAKPTDGEQSTGLGLCIVKKYVEKMKGKVWAESIAGEGSSFIVEFKKTA